MVHRELFVSCSDTVMLLGTTGTQCVETWLGENTIPLIILNCGIAYGCTSTGTDNRVRKLFD